MPAPATPAKKKGLRFKDNPTQYITNIAMLVALAYVIMAIGRIPIPFAMVGKEPLKFDPKDVVIVIGGFIFGPYAAVYISVLVSLIEMITVSTTGFYGAVMNVFSTLCFVLPAVIIYRKKRNIKGALLGLATGVVTVTAMMLFWNWVIVPFYLQATSMASVPVTQIRDRVIPMLLPIFLPFNLLKATLNASIIMLLYKPLVSALRKASILPGSEFGKDYKINNTKNILTIVISVLFIVGSLLLLLLVQSWK